MDNANTPKTMHPLVALALVAGIVAAVAYISITQAKHNDSVSTREMATTCDPNMGNAYHVHPKLEIWVDGTQVPVDPNIGVRAGCMTRLHTHEGDGTIHVESPQQRDFTLGDFFAVWDKPFSKEQVLDYKTENGKKITVLVNDVPVDTYENTPLSDLAKITIRYE